MGYTSLATGTTSFAFGRNTLAGGNYSHAEGDGTTAIGHASHTEGKSTTASGKYGSHAGGNNSIASGTTSFIHSTNSLVTGDRSVILGGQNITGTTDDTVYVPNLNLCEFGGTLYTSSISGCSPITIGEANFPQGITVNDLPLLSQTQVKVSLTTAQLKTAYSVPIDAGIAAPGAGKAIIVTSLAVDYTVGVGGEGPDPFNFTRGNIRLQISGASSTGSGSQYATDDPGGGTGILNTTAFLPNMFIQGGNIGASTPSIFPNRILHITTDSDATLGSGSAIVYFTYYLLDI